MIEKMLIVIGGIFNLLVALFHMFIGKVLNWPESIACLDYMNRSVMYMLNNHVALSAFIFFLLCFLFPKDLLSTRLGNMMLGSMAAFYFIRGIYEFIYYDMSQIFSGLNFIPLLIFFITGFIYLIPLLRVMGNKFEEQ